MNVAHLHDSVSWFPILLGFLGVVCFSLAKRVRLQLRFDADAQWIGDRQKNVDNRKKRRLGCLGVFCAMFLAPHDQSTFANIPADTINNFSMSWC